MRAPEPLQQLGPSQNALRFPGDCFGRMLSMPAKGWRNVTRQKPPFAWRKYKCQIGDPSGKEHQNHDYWYYEFAAF